jgi:cobalamin biosynthesis Mg chelatase CobN
MTHLSPSNAKLIDRAIRYVLALDDERDYATVAKQALALPTLERGMSLVQCLLNKS